MAVFSGKSIANRFSKTIVVILLVFFSGVVGTTFLLELFRINKLEKSELKQSAVSALGIMEIRFESLIISVKRTSTNPLSINSLVDVSSSDSHFKFALADLIQYTPIDEAVVFNYSGEFHLGSAGQKPEWFSASMVGPALSNGKSTILQLEGDLFIIEPISYYRTIQGGIIARVELDKWVTQSIPKNIPLYTVQISNNWQLSTVPDNFTGISETVTPTLHSLLDQFTPSVTLYKSRGSITGKILPWLVSLSAFGLAGMALMFLFAHKIGHSMAKPIISLTERVNSATYPVGPTGTGDELEVLALAFDQTTSNYRKANTEKMNAERNARQSQLKAIVDTVVDGIITINKSGVIVTFNPAAERIFGYSADTVIGKNVSMLMPAPDARSHNTYLHNYHETGIAKIIGIGRELTGKRKDRSTFPMELAISEMHVAGRQMFTGIVRDITERKETERMKSEFISTVSHELRTPLTSIRGALGLVLGKHGTDLPGKSHRMIETAFRNSERLTLLINDILDIEKLKSEQLAFDLTPVNLADLVGQSLDDNQGFADKHDVQLIFENNAPYSTVEGDSHRLLQVMANLLSNAVKYAPKGGKVTVVIDSSESRIKVSVIDQGSGIPPEFRDRIFQRFAQADSSDTRKAGGTGLGLSITKAIVEHHGGTIDYHSTLGEGSTFFFEIPEFIYAPAAHERQQKKVDTEGVYPHAKILHLEEDLDVSLITRTLLENMAEIREATTLERAKRLLAHEHFDLVLLDLKLPDGNGEELVNELGSMLPPVIIYSAYIPSQELADKVCCALLKSKTSNEKLKSEVSHILSMNRHREAM